MDLVQFIKYSDITENVMSVMASCSESDGCSRHSSIASP